MPRFAVQMAHFVRVISGQEAPPVLGVEGIRSLEVAKAIATSASTGAAGKIGERIMDDGMTREQEQTERQTG